MWSHLSFLLVFLVGISSQQQTRKPHIIFILADDLGWNDVGFHGSNLVPTPNIDALAYSGLILNNHYVTPLCSPTRAALLTARHPIRTGMWERVLNSTQPYGLALDEKILPQYLHDHGYATHCVGKWHLGFFRHTYTPTYRGFDSFFGQWNSRIDYFDHQHLSFGGYRGLDMHRGLEPVPEYVGEYATRLFTRKAIDVVRAHNTSEPLFLYMPHLATHIGNHDNPLQAPQETIDKLQHIHPYKRRVFAAMVNELDNSVGQLVEALGQRGMLEDSIIVFATDNGGASSIFSNNPGNNWPLRSGKGTTWEGGVKGTAFVWSPLLASSNRVSRQLMHIQDWVPSLLGAFNQVPSGSPHTLDGVNLWPALNNPEMSAREEVLNMIDPVSQFSSIRVGKWKLTIGSPTWGLADGWYKTPDREGEYNITSVMESTTARVLANTTRSLPPTEIIWRLREEATLAACQNVTEVTCVPTSQQPCLFDVEADHCEKINLAASEPKIVASLLAALERHNTNVVPSRAKPADPMSNPSNWNGTWVPWYDFTHPITV